mmetsp:Transcript_106205/g.307378  ORF Transcript_106205/g.307378 Transcript_106205/m.307378 type:complete len:248 (-) Transcript_106205:144-887(-)
MGRVACALEEVEVAHLMLGEDHISDLLSSSWGSPQQVRSNVAYMQALIRHMHAFGRMPDSEKLEVNRQGIVTSGNHRVLAAWLLRWGRIRCFRGDQVAGWRVRLDESRRQALEEVLDVPSILALQPPTSMRLAPAIAAPPRRNRSQDPGDRRQHLAASRCCFLGVAACPAPTAPPLRQPWQGKGVCEPRGVCGRAADADSSTSSQSGSDDDGSDRIAVGRVARRIMLSDGGKDIAATWRRRWIEWTS